MGVQGTEQFRLLTVVQSKLTSTLERLVRNRDREQQGII